MLETRHPKLPEDPRFYQHVLDHLPTPALVVGRDGTVLYGNRALVEMSGWGFDEGIGLQMLNVIHPDDLTYVLDSFSSVLSASMRVPRRKNNARLALGLLTMRVAVY